MTQGLARFFPQVWARPVIAVYRWPDGVDNEPPLSCVPQTSFEMTFVAKGYSRYWAFRPPVEGAAEEGEEGGDPDAAESARALPPVPEGGPDVTVVTVVKGPEPGDVLTSATRIYRIVLGRYHALVTATRSKVPQDRTPLRLQNE